jgi:non-ribosomal peptide synthetase component F
VVVVDWSVLAGWPQTDPEPVTGPDNTAYVVYPTAVTAQSNGVCITHANVVRLMRAAQEHYSFDESDAWTLLHSYADEVSPFEVWGALLNGGRLVVAPLGAAGSPDELLDLLVAHRTTVLCPPPSTFRTLADAAAAGDPRIADLSLRAVVLRGQGLAADPLRSWLDRRGPGRTALAGRYGPSEVGGYATHQRLTRRALGPAAAGRIGRPLSGVRIQLLDDAGAEVSAGAPGEVHIGGPTVARGYLNRPAQTAERFVPDPDGPPGSRRYRSGDLARRAPGGALEYIGPAEPSKAAR